MPTGDDRANDVLDSIYGSDRSNRFPATVYVALYVGGVEGGYSNYDRAAVANTDAEWPDAVSREKTNANQINFPVPAEDTDEFDSVAIHGHATNDDIIHFESLTSPLFAPSGADLYIPAESLVITIPGDL